MWSESQQVRPWVLLTYALRCKKVYIKSIIAHAAGTGIKQQTGQVYFTQAGVTTGPTTKIFDVDIQAGETVLLEPSYPIVLAENGDTLAVGTGNITGVAATHVNFMITGDKQSWIHESIKMSSLARTVSKLLGVRERHPICQ